ncbi:hypothetical protein KI387_038970, partial [Taxus chinensis]
ASYEEGNSKGEVSGYVMVGVGHPLMGYWTRDNQLGAHYQSSDRVIIDSFFR